MPADTEIQYRSKIYPSIMPPDTFYQLLRLLLFIILYGFIGVVIWTIWQDIKSTRQLINLSLSAKGTLIETSTDHYHTVTPVTSVGRSSGNTVILQDTTVSMQHALITRRDAMWWLEDLESRNGTQLNSQPVNNPTVIS
ncbi:MAG: FHA domain-containing protein, partial [Anaerolineales bacterium]|nr:FHA domain-containing protein [Anaerolineales bacterium]